METSLSSYISNLTIFQGRFAGQKFEIHPWERTVLRDGFDGNADINTSIARGNGKTTFIAAIGAATINGPLQENGADNIIVASSYTQALVIFRHLHHFLLPSIERDTKRFSVQDSINRASIRDKKTGSSISLLSSDPRRLHGHGPKLVIGDECAQWPRPESMLSALRTSLGKLQNSRMILLGTRASEPSHPFELELRNPSSYSVIYSTPKDDNPFLLSSWKKANPGIQFLPDLKAAIKKESLLAKKDAGFLQSFRALRLNQGCSDILESVLFDAETWLSFEGHAEQKGGYLLGLDPGASNAMSAASAYHYETGCLDAFAVWPEQPSLIQRARNDGVEASLYQAMAKRNELIIAGSRVADIRALLQEAFGRWGKPDAILTDRYREAEMRQELERADFPFTEFITRGFGYKDGSEDLRLFRKACLNGHVTPRENLLLRSAMRECRTITDASANSKVCKTGEGSRRRGAKDDAVCASLLCVAEGERRRVEKVSESSSLVMGTVTR